MNSQRIARITAAVTILWLLLILPDHLKDFTSATVMQFPLELPILLLLLLVFQGRAVPPLRLLITALITLMTVLKLADIVSRLAFTRGFNPALDMPLIAAAWRLTSGAVGGPLAFLAALALTAGLVAVAWMTWWATAQIARQTLGSRPRVACALLLLPAFLLTILDAARISPRLDPPGAAFTSRLAYGHLRDALAARADLAEFRLRAADDPYASTPAEDLLTALAGTDIYVIFVESYGRAALENPLYSDTIEPILARTEIGLAQRGMLARSAWLTAPMVGGQSWLAHGSLLSGLRLDTDARYRALITSPRQTLLRLAQRAGWRTVAVMPAITLAWPEAGFFGYDLILAAADLDYRGKPFNWVTMPDQFTLASFERQALAPGPRAPVLAEIALISSHAPWTPIPPMLAWDELGDGSIFDPHATAGDSPETVWSDSDRVRDQYRQSLAYSLSTVGGFADRRASTAPLIIILGDHQPVEFVSGGFGGRDVPVHMIGPADLLKKLDAWHWTPGLVPSASAPVWPMENFRDYFLRAFGPE